MEYHLLNLADEINGHTMINLVWQELTVRLRYKKWLMSQGNGVRSAEADVYFGFW